MEELVGEAVIPEISSGSASVCCITANGIPDLNVRGIISPELELRDETDEDDKEEELLEEDDEEEDLKKEELDIEEEEDEF